MSAKENGATAVVFDDQQQVLLHRRRDFRVWALPGGRIEDGESGAVAAIRETQEETGYEITIERCVGEYVRPQLSANSQHVYVGTVVGGAPLQQGPETREVRWFPVHTLPRSLPTSHRIVIQDALAPAAPPCKHMLTLPLMEVLLIRLLLRLRDLWQQRGF